MGHIGDGLVIEFYLVALDTNFNGNGCKNFAKNDSIKNTPICATRDTGRGLRKWKKQVAFVSTILSTPLDVCPPSLSVRTFILLFIKVFIFE